VGTGESDFQHSMKGTTKLYTVCKFLIYNLFYI